MTWLTRPPATTNPAPFTACPSSTSTRPKRCLSSSAQCVQASPALKTNYSILTTPACFSATPKNPFKPSSMNSNLLNSHKLQFMGAEKKSTAAVTLNDVGLFQGLSSIEMALVKTRLKEEFFQKGNILFYEGKHCERVFIIQTGRVKVFRTTPAGREQILEILGPGDSC